MPGAERPSWTRFGRSLRTVGNGEISATHRFLLGSHPVGADAPPLLIAEVGQAHDGSLGAAHAYIDAIADAGAHAVKFQTHLAAAESTPAEPWRVMFSRQDRTRYDYWRRMEFSSEAWGGLKDHAVERGLVFLSSPFSEAAVELLERLDVPAYKIGSGEVTNVPLLERVRATGRPVLLSSGLSTWAELDAAFAVFPGPKAVLQCTSRYPCPPEAVGLGSLAALRDRYRCPVGLSDHSATVHAGVAAVALGAALVEVHVVFDRRCFGPDTASSVTVDELAELGRGMRFVHAARGARDKDESAASLEDMKRRFEKSVVLERDRPAGHRLGREDLGFKKPGTGIPARRYPELIGRRLARAVGADVPLTEEDLA